MKEIRKLTQVEFDSMEELTEFVKKCCGIAFYVNDYLYEYTEVKYCHSEGYLHLDDDNQSDVEERHLADIVGYRYDD